MTFKVKQTAEVEVRGTDFIQSLSEMLKHVPDDGSTVASVCTAGDNYVLRFVWWEDRG